MKSSVKDVTKRIKEQDKTEKKEKKGEKKEQDIRSGADDTWNADEQAETEFVGARDEALHADQDGGAEAEGTQVRVVARFLYECMLGASVCAHTSC